MATTDGHVDSKFKPAAARLPAYPSDVEKNVVCPGVYDGLTARIALRQASTAFRQSLSQVCATSCHAIWYLRGVFLLNSANIDWDLFR